MVVVGAQQKQLLRRRETARGRTAAAAATLPVALERRSLSNVEAWANTVLLSPEIIWA